MADAHGSGPCEATHAGSTPVICTNKSLNGIPLLSVLFGLFVYSNQIK